MSVEEGNGLKVSCCKILPLSFWKNNCDLFIMYICWLIIVLILMFCYVKSFSLKSLLNSIRDSNPSLLEFISFLGLYIEWTSAYMSSVLKHVAMFKAEIELTSCWMFHSYIVLVISWLGLDHLSPWSHLDIYQLTNRLIYIAFACCLYW